MSFIKARNMYGIHASDNVTILRLLGLFNERYRIYVDNWLFVHVG